MIDLILTLLSLGILGIALWLLGAIVVYIVSKGNICDG